MSDQNDVPKGYKIAEKIQQLIESAGATKLHATDIWQKVLKEELADLEDELNRTKAELKEITDGFVETSQTYEKEVKKSAIFMYGSRF